MSTRLIHVLSVCLFVCYCEKENEALREDPHSADISGYETLQHLYSRLYQPEHFYKVKKISEYLSNSTPAEQQLLEYNEHGLKTRHQILKQNLIAQSLELDTETEIKYDDRGNRTEEVLRYYDLSSKPIQIKRTTFAYQYNDDLLYKEIQTDYDQFSKEMTTLTTVYDQKGRPIDITELNHYAETQKISKFYYKNLYIERLEQFENEKLINATIFDQQKNEMRELSYKFNPNGEEVRVIRYHGNFPSFITIYDRETTANFEISELNCSFDNSLRKCHKEVKTKSSEYIKTEDYEQKVQNFNVNFYSEIINYPLFFETSIINKSFRSGELWQEEAIKTQYNSSWLPTIIERTTSHFTPAAKSKSLPTYSKAVRTYDLNERKIIKQENFESSKDQADSWVMYDYE